MKRVFLIINSIVVLASVLVASLTFFLNTSTGKSIFDDIYNFSSSPVNENIYYDLNKCSVLSETALSSASITNQQSKHIETLSNCIKKLDEFQTDLAHYLLFDNSKSKESLVLLKQIEKLADEKNDLIFEIDVYLIKMSGNTIGDPLGSYNHFVNYLLNYIDSYNHTFKNIYNYVSKNVSNEIETKLNVINLYSNSINLLVNSYENYDFTHHALQTIQLMNLNFNLDNNNLIVKNGLSVYSNEAINFNKTYNSCDKNVLVENYYTFSNTDIDISTEQNIETKCYYYLNKLLGVL
ncbi:MAG: hypothetical protein IJX26_02000 [Clostridia bacterium]|nr:hypothetical protein [Clostridia bacterium]